MTPVLEPPDGTSVPVDIVDPVDPLPNQTKTSLSLAPVLTLT